MMVSGSMDQRGGGSPCLNALLRPAGFAAITNIDVSNVAIQQMIEKYKDKEGMTCANLQCVHFMRPVRPLMAACLSQGKS